MTGEWVVGGWEVSAKLVLKLLKAKNQFKVIHYEWNAESGFQVCAIGGGGGGTLRNDIVTVFGANIDLHDVSVITLLQKVHPL